MPLPCFHTLGSPVSFKIDGHITLAETVLIGEMMRDATELNGRIIQTREHIMQRGTLRLNNLALRTWIKSIIRIILVTESGNIIFNNEFRSRITRPDPRPEWRQFNIKRQYSESKRPVRDFKFKIWTWPTASWVFQRLGTYDAGRITYCLHMDYNSSKSE